jgi:hypothetical protein
MTAPTLARLLGSEQIKLRRYGALILDTQGSELLVLQRAISILEPFQNGGYQLRVLCWTLPTCRTDKLHASTQA